jgi:hypothetical protein
LYAVGELWPDVILNLRADVAFSDISATNEWDSRRAELDISDAVSVVESEHATTNQIVHFGL